MIRTHQALCALAPCVLIPLSGCQTMPLVQAEQTCLYNAQQAQYGYPYGYPPTGSLGIGIGSGGYSGVGLGFNFSPGYFMNGNPDQVYANCVHSKSGAYPTQPYSTLPQSQMYRPYP